MLRDIYDHIAADNPSAAAKVIEGIFAKAQILHRFPEIGHKYRDDAEGEIRILLYGHDRIAYLRRDTEVIEVLGVFHSALDIARYLP